MAPNHLRLLCGRQHLPSVNTAQVKFTPTPPQFGGIDGVWWPRTRHLTAELPLLLDALKPHVGTPWRVAYNPHGWTLGAPRMLRLGERAVQLVPQRFELGNIVYILGIDGAKIVLRVIPPAARSRIPFR
ncbi:DUF5994 family protein [Nocardia sp. XZ_19_385]|uniref:DUF5994 family protein n=1 Tax=Nocardia sp. XZ_19_385 TaxID=2769488 RepID=UPI00188E783C|nr:DUF5994 family protein [Nocardia sp. XZ_19_385]